jgi:murein tripeptide amidase MpaA
MHLKYDGYLNYEELGEALHGLAGDHPGLCRVYSIGKSYEGREIWLAELTSSATGPAEEKPAFWVDGNTHAGEVTGSMAALYLIDYLLSNYGGEERVTRLMDEQAFYVLPRLSPDGAERYLTTPYNLRATTRPWPFEEEEPGLHAEDVDGDGEIVQMRLEDPNGEWKVSGRDERLMVPRGPDERGGTYYRIYREGYIKDYDGFEIKVARPLHGLDMNRQYPYAWESEASQQGAGPYPLSEPEARAQVEFILDRKNIFSVHTYHTFSGVLLRPSSDKPDSEMPEHDLAAYKAIGERGREITGYPPLSVYHDFRYTRDRTITGTFDDWAYEGYGAFGWTIELWSMAEKAGIEIEDYIEFIREPGEENGLKMLRWNDEELGGKGFADWREFDHPQLGRVEIGGWKTKYTIQNPPPHLLEEEARKVVMFSLAHAACAPRLTGELDVRELAGGLRRVELRVENAGYLPTNVSQLARDKKLVREIEAELTLPEGAELESGDPRAELGHLSGRSSLGGSSWKSPAFFAGMDSDHRRRVVWIVRGPGKIGVEVRSERAGTLRLEAG